MADTCVEGHRKKAKYLLDEEELGTSVLPNALLDASKLMLTASHCREPQETGQAS